MIEIRLTVRCTKDEDHAKVLRLDEGAGMELAEALAALLDGSSPYYIHPPGSRSPMGICAQCGAALKCTIEQRETKKEKQ